MEIALMGALLLALYAAYAIGFILLMKFIARKLSLQQSTQLFCMAAAGVGLFVWLVISDYRVKGFHVELLHVLLAAPLVSLIVHAFRTRQSEKAADEHR
ncbi:MULTISPECIES: hypothetical protein [Paenibacillus]|uniref:hypothetical protein n=1 Tax=Paenibacillus TaxID=44249 RepID=UPI0022B8B317|nr:hypothetical protein [Paenibacillus caseinilyticus]MCZ8519874.1 hypothetical protein [Paenibacillus caseinilyticus]